MTDPYGPSLTNTNSETTIVLKKWNTGKQIISAAFADAVIGYIKEKVLCLYEGLFPIAIKKNFHVISMDILLNNSRNTTIFSTAVTGYQRMV